jgi:hypothetical protein
LKTQKKKKKAAAAEKSEAAIHKIRKEVDEAQRN